MLESKENFLKTNERTNQSKTDFFFFRSVCILVTYKAPQQVVCQVCARISNQIQQPINLSIFIRFACQRKNYCVCKRFYDLKRNWVMFFFKVQNSHNVSPRAISYNICMYESLLYKFYQKMFYHFIIIKTSFNQYRPARVLQVSHLQISQLYFFLRLRFNCISYIVQV